MIGSSLTTFSLRVGGGRGNHQVLMEGREGRVGVYRNGLPHVPRAHTHIHTGKDTKLDGGTCVSVERLMKPNLGSQQRCTLSKRSRSSFAVPGSANETR